MCFGGGRRFRLPTPFGGDEEDRTPDPLLAKQVLSQLSYTPTRLCLEPLVLNSFQSLYRRLGNTLFAKLPLSLG